jgi:hypothetical protein
LCEGAADGGCRLDDKKEQLLEKELVLEEISSLADRLRQQAAEVCTRHATSPHASMQATCTWKMEKQT